MNKGKEKKTHKSGMRNKEFNKLKKNFLNNVFNDLILYGGLI
jgi:hypothetical protein